MVFFLLLLYIGEKPLIFNLIEGGHNSQYVLSWEIFVSQARYLKMYYKIFHKLFLKQFKSTKKILYA